MNKFVLASLFSLSYITGTAADTIYQWSDPWGQIQYSKTPVPGAMVSDLTELPETQETTEQQKQDAMVRKLQEMKQRNLNRIKQAEIQEQLKSNALDEKNHCKQLRILMADMQSYYLWQYPLFGAPIFPGYYGQLHHDLSREIQNKCR